METHQAICLQRDVYNTGTHCIDRRSWQPFAVSSMVRSALLTHYAQMTALHPLELQIAPSFSKLRSKPEARHFGRIYWWNDAKLHIKPDHILCWSKPFGKVTIMDTLNLHPSHASSYLACIILKHLSLFRLLDISFFQNSEIRIYRAYGDNCGNLPCIVISFYLSFRVTLKV